jgi:hypothetical protein
MSAKDHESEGPAPSGARPATSTSPPRAARDQAAARPPYSARAQDAHTSAESRRATLVQGRDTQIGRGQAFFVLRAVQAAGRSRAWPWHTHRPSHAREGGTRRVETCASGGQGERRPQAQPHVCCEAPTRMAQYILFRQAGGAREHNAAGRQGQARAQGTRTSGPTRSGPPCRARARSPTQATNDPRSREARGHVCARRQQRAAAKGTSVRAARIGRGRRRMQRYDGARWLELSASARQAARTSTMLRGAAVRQGQTRAQGTRTAGRLAPGGHARRA